MIHKCNVWQAGSLVNDVGFQAKVVGRAGALAEHGAWCGGGQDNLVHTFLS